MKLILASNILQVVADLDVLVPTIAAVLSREMAKPDFKIILFFTTARLTGYMASVFSLIGLRVLEIHSRKSQSVRTKTSDQFRDSTNVILFSRWAASVDVDVDGGSLVVYHLLFFFFFHSFGLFSDVSARGMDYPDVTFVLQVGLTEREQYIHRLGRTVRIAKVSPIDVPSPSLITPTSPTRPLYSLEICASPCALRISVLCIHTSYINVFVSVVLWLYQKRLALARRGRACC